MHPETYVMRCVNLATMRRRGKLISHASDAGMSEEQTVVFMTSRFENVSKTLYVLKKSQFTGIPEYDLALETI